MKKVFYTLIFLLPFLGYSQQKTDLDRQIGLEATLLGAGVFYEQPITKNILGEVSVGYLGTIIRSEWWFGTRSDLVFNPYSRVSVKAYYNRGKRIKRGKSISHNWGNFIGIQNKVMYGFQKYDLPYMINEVHWGVQTELENRLLLTFTAGIGYNSATNKNKEGFTPTLDLRLKYVLF